MKYSDILLIFFILTAMIASCQSQNEKKDTAIYPVTQTMQNDTLMKTDEEWKKILSPERYRILREKGTERPYSGEYYLHNEKGVYCCAACKEELFYSDAKFDAGCGWPSFFQPVDSTKITYTEDRSHGMIRAEITCTKCGGHLGHVFDDGPMPTGLRYCVNSLSLEFKKQ